MTEDDVALVQGLFAPGVFQADGQQEVRVPRMHRGMVRVHPRERVADRCASGQVEFQPRTARQIAQPGKKLQFDLHGSLGEREFIRRLRRFPQIGRGGGKVHRAPIRRTFAFCILHFALPWWRMTVANAAAPPAAGLIQRRLRAVRRRWWAHVFVAFYGWFLPCGAMAALGWGIIRFFMGKPVVDVVETVCILIVAPVAMALQVTFGFNGTVLSIRRTAMMIDRRARTHDRFQTAFAFAEHDPATRTPRSRTRPC